MQNVSRDEVKRMLDRREATLVEVLDEKQFNDFHLPGAINVPLSGDFETEIQHAVPDKRQPVIVYCKDENCDASPKAAAKMENLGYTAVYDYEAGKEDWKNAGFTVH